MSPALLSLAADDPHAMAAAVAGPAWAGLILLLPVISMVLCGLCMALGVKTKAPGWITVGLLAISFALTLGLYGGYDGPQVIHLFDWINLHWGEGTAAGAFVADVALYVDGLTLLWMLFVTGLGTLIALYATEYMEADVGKGYGRFYAGVSVFIFAMACLVMADNLLLLYLGWEGVGFASYWLIGYYYRRPSAVAAAKKAFIMNRIGDLGLALAIYLIYTTFGTVRYDELFVRVTEATGEKGVGGWTTQAIPFLLMLAAFSKSAQIPLYVWLPDAMEGPTPVSALIHAATMVTAGVYLLCRMFPVMELHEHATATVAWVGGLTALLSATIAMAQYDIKRIMAYSTVSQLGYMFMGVGLLHTAAGAYHVFTHAFFKAVLFLTCGAIMHGFAGQLDLRRLSGLQHIRGWKITSFTMLYACACLAGVPFISSGFWSKDAIMAQAFINEGSGFKALGMIALVTAMFTAYYAFRVWFRVCAGPVQFEMGDEHHGDDDHGHGDDHAQPHAPRLAINFTLLVISAGAVASIFLKDWSFLRVEGSTASTHPPHPEGEAFWADPHKWMMVAAGGVGLFGILVAWWFHLANRAAADELRSALLANPVTRWLPTAMENKWYVDEFYHVFIRAPLWLMGHGWNLFDRWVIDGLVVDGLFGRGPRWLGRIFQPLHNGLLQSYAVTMAGGVAGVAILAIYVPALLDPEGPGPQWLRNLFNIFGGGGG